MERVLDDKDIELFTIFHDLFKDYSDVIRTNRTKAINIVGDFLAQYRPELNFVRSMIAEGILETLLDVSKYSDHEKKMIIGKARLSATQKLGFDYAFSNHLIDICIIALGEETEENTSSSLEGLSRMERDLILLKNVDVSGVIDTVELNYDQLTIINKHFSNYESEIFKREIYPMLIAFTEKVPNLWTVLNVYSRHEMLEVILVTKIFMRAFYLKLSIIYYGIDCLIQDCTSRISMVDNHCRLIRNYSVDAQDVRYADIFLPLNDPQVTGEILKCKEYIKKLIIRDVPKELRKLAVMDSNQEELSEYLDWRYTTNIINLFSWCMNECRGKGQSYSDRRTPESFETLVIELSRKKVVDWVLLTSGKYISSMKIRCGTVIGKMRISVLFRLCCTAIGEYSLKTYFQFMEPKEFKVSARHVCVRGHELFDILEKIYLNLGIEELKDEFLKNAITEAQADTKKRKEVSESIVQERQEKGDLLIAWRFCKHNEQLLDEDLLVYEDILQATAKEKIYWTLKKNIKTNQGNQYFFETFYSYTFIQANVIHKNDFVNGNVNEEVVFSVDPRYFQDESIDTSTPKIVNKKIGQRLVKSYRKLIQLVDKDKKVLSEQEKKTVIKNAMLPDAIPWVKELRKDGQESVDMDAFFVERDEFDMSLYSLYYEDKALFDVIESKIKIEKSLLEYVKCHERTNSTTAMLEYKLINRIRLSDLELLKATRRDLLKWEKSDERVFNGKVMTFSYTAIYDGNPVVTRYETNMLAGLIVEIGRSNTKGNEETEN